MQKVIFGPLKDVLEMLSYAVTIAALIFAYVQYNASVEKDRVDKSIEYVLEFHSPETFPHRQRLEKPWLNYDLKRLSAQTSNAEAIDELARRFLRDDPEATISLVYIVNNLDMIAHCVQQEICSKAIIGEHLGLYARNLYCLYGKEIEKMRTERLLTGFGAGIQAVAGTSKCSSADNT